MHDQTRLSVNFFAGLVVVLEAVSASLVEDPHEGEGAFPLEEV